MSYYARLLLAYRDEPRVARRYAAMLIANAPAPYFACNR